MEIKQPQNPTKINVHESWELRYWSNKFGVTPEKLKDAVRVPLDPVSHAFGNTSAYNFLVHDDCTRRAESEPRVQRVPKL